MSQIYANTTHLYIRDLRILRFSHPSLKPPLADTKGTIHVDNCTGSTKSEPLRDHMCDTLREVLRAATTESKAHHDPGQEKTGTWFQTGA